MRYVLSDTCEYAQCDKNDVTMTQKANSGTIPAYKISTSDLTLYIFSEY